jgi:hypothetical protein
VNRQLSLAALLALAMPAKPALAETVLQGELSCEAAHGDDLLGRIECWYNRQFDFEPVRGSCTWPVGQVMVLDRNATLRLEAESRCLGLALIVENHGEERQACSVTVRMAFAEDEIPVFSGPLPSGRLTILEAENQYDSPDVVRVDCAE